MFPSMKEFIYSRNAVYEALRAKRRDVFKIQIAEGAQEKGHLADILNMAKDRRIPVEKVQRARLDKIQQLSMQKASELDQLEREYKALTREQE